MPEYSSFLADTVDHGVKGGLNMWKEFKAFAIKGNAIDLAVGVIIGAAFGNVVGSLVKDIIMPPITLLTGGLNFANKFFLLRPGKGGVWDFPTPEAAIAAGAVPWTYGTFLTTLITFLITAFAIFLLIQALSKMTGPAPASAPTTKPCPFCTSAIPLGARKCPLCTADLPASA